MASLVLPFSMRGRAGNIHVSVSANDDPVALGCDLLDPALAQNAAHGFPVCEAVPVIDLQGYAAGCGWIQVVRSSDASGEFEMDPLALFRGVNTPFAFFGVKPTLFDAPFRASRDDLSWTARSFLCALPDAVVSKVVVPLAAFTWGFAVTPATITIKPPAELELDAWAEHLPLLRSSFPGWTFDGGGAGEGNRTPTVSLGS